MNNSETRRLTREKYKDIRNIRTTTTAAPTTITTAISSYLTSSTSSTTSRTWSPSLPVVTRRQPSSRSKYKSSEANYLALRRNNNYKARQYQSSTSPGMSTLASVGFSLRNWQFDEIFFFINGQFNWQVLKATFQHQSISEVSRMRLGIWSTNWSQTWKICSDSTKTFCPLTVPSWRKPSSQR